MENEYEQNIINLKVLGKLTSGDVLYTKSRYFQIISNAWIPFFVSRWWYGESRRSMLKDVSLLIITSKLFLEDIDTPDNIKKSISISLENSKSGIRELNKQYKSDAYTSSRIELMINNIDELLIKYAESD